MIALLIVKGVLLIMAISFAVSSLRIKIEVDK
jgi:hypothetical protein